MAEEDKKEGRLLVYVGEEILARFDGYKESELFSSRSDAMRTILGERFGVDPGVKRARREEPEEKTRMTIHAGKALRDRIKTVADLHGITYDEALERILAEKEKAPREA